MKVFNELQNLYKEKEQNNLVIFVGAGISENYTESKGKKKYPSWKKLVDELVSPEIDKDKFDFLKIAQIFQDNNSKEAVVQKIKDIFPDDVSFKNEDWDNCVHKLIFDIEPAHILTTNYDNLLEKAMRLKEKDIKYHVVDTDELIPLSKSKQSLLVKAHGDLYRGNIVLTEQDYNDYEKNFPLILSFIRYVFSKYKVLFIGFSLADPNFNKILYWVKNILEENSIKHTVILHSDISESERIHFEKKSVNVITSNQIINEILKPDSNKEEYLSEALKFIEKGFPTQKYESKQRLDVLKENLKSLNYFRYLLPEMVSSFLDNTYLTFNYESSPEIIKDKKTEKKETRYSWVSNIIQTDSFLDGKEKLNFFQLFTGDSQVIKADKGFINNYFNDIGKMLLSTNISSLGYLNSTENQKSIKELITLKSKEIEYLLTYEYKKIDKTEEIDEKDKSFNEDSPYFKELIFDKSLFFSHYLLGDKSTAYKKCKNEEYGDDLEKYLIYFRLHYMWNNRKIEEVKDLDSDSYGLYEHIFNGMNKNNQKVFEHIHSLKFLQNYFMYITDLENDFVEMEKNTKNVIFSNRDKKTLYLISFYISYSRFLKFVFLNKLPIIDNDIFQKAVHKSNMFYFNYFMKDSEGKNVEIPNWFLVGILIDLNIKNIESQVILTHNKYFDNPYKLSFDKLYIRKLFESNIDSLDNDGYLKFSNLLYIFSLSTQNEENYIFLLDLFIDILKKDIRYLEVFSKQLHISHINYVKNNQVSEGVKSKLLIILNMYAKNRLDYESDDYKNIDDDVFANFIFDLDIDFDSKDDEIIEKLNNDFEKLPCKNLTSLILVLKYLGYDSTDLEKLLDVIEKTFNEPDFYVNPSPFNKCPNHIENSIVNIYTHYGIDLGISKIEEHYFNLLKNDLRGDGYSSRTSDSIGWLLFLKDNDCLNDDIIEELNNQDMKEKLVKQLDFAFKNESNLMFNNYGINIKNKIVEFLIKTNNFEIIKEVFEGLTYDKNSEYFLKMLVYLIKRHNMIEEYKSEIIDLIELIENRSIHSGLYLSTKQILSIGDSIEKKELKLILTNILESKKDSL